ncbi:MAG: CpsD/CapB family tyrosine-protein kinase [Clostridium sp.]|uniref:CpsD/CapB family tyrosine-protein kinase n=1 Tax=Clostridium sp. TaxID=1506 RepID=UPI001EB47A7C|nr:CpsD/CapB family tyrosine-protein kinase [Clostridium sp.]MBS5884521.1 CpsD/CapB family tyrosine-protein kinase [Clostridium sp.]MDU7147851.1 CpsD/CapB family tyrosine-protein kinase [Clostridium sp.]MDU7241729.1 CpsD/CapB family tyrosine-protein kinase [Clostridium sp.]
MFIVEKEPKSIAAESYRTLRTNIQYSSFDKDYKVIMVTSSEPGEGKSTTSGNLALCLAQGDKKVVLIDCDLRKPSIHKKFKVSNIVGLSDVIIGKEELVAALHRYNKNLVILTSGKIPPNPSEMLSSKAMTALIENLKENFDYIILDTPPVQAVTDSQILSTKADGSILVVRSEKTKKDSVQNAIGLLKKVNANIIGTVLNGVDNSKNKYNYYYGEK